MPIFDFLNPDLPPGLPTVAMPVLEATDAALAGYGRLVTRPDDCAIEIVRWPAVGTRPVDEDTGDEAGTTEGVFVSEWKGDVLYGRNEAVGGHYILGYGTDPAQAREDHALAPCRMLLWHANYHPDGGQLFLPLDHKPFYVPLALPGDDVVPDRFVCFRFQGIAASTSTPASGTRACSPSVARSASSTGRVRCMPASPSTSRANSGAFWKPLSQGRLGGTSRNRHVDDTKSNGAARGTIIGPTQRRPLSGCASATIRQRMRRKLMRLTPDPGTTTGGRQLSG